ncbi:MAG: archaellar assembly protein FlaJ [Dehalococcoidales bacterium]|nr:MAG: archaellar assembly protein FlaJ [Dehalococcoidales bacterium]
MGLLKLWLKRKGVEIETKESVKVKENSTDNSYADMDFYCQLTYMAAIATSGISRSGLFSHASKLPYTSARHFKRVDFVAKAFNHDYAEACNIVGQATNEPDVKEFLLRLSGALSSGEDIAAFLERESQVVSESYGNHYERKLDTLTKWSDAYIALIMTSAIVTVMAVVTLMIGNATTMFIVILSVLTMVITMAGAWLIYRATPKEKRVHSLSCRSSEQEWARRISKVSLAAGILVVALMFLMKVELGWIMMTIGVFLTPLGLMSKIDDNKINKRDIDIAGFLRSLGGVSQAIGATVSEAMGRLDFRSLSSLKEDVELLHTRIMARINHYMCWNRFVGETGSEQVNRSVRIFWDAITIGGEPQKVSNDASTFAMKIALLRAKRSMIGSGFLWLVMTMHAVLTSLLVFIYEIMITFTNLLQSISPDLKGDGATANIPTLLTFSSSTGELNLLHLMIIVIILVLAISNAWATFSINGGHVYCLTFYLALTAYISGIALIIVPPLVSMLFSGIV